MPSHVISATEASRSLSNILNKVHYQGESYEITRGKEVIAKIIPASPKKPSMKVSDLNGLFQYLPSLDSNDSQAFEKDIEQIRNQMKYEDNSWD